MTTRTPATQGPGVPPEKGIELLERQIAAVQQQLIDCSGKETPAFDRWVVETSNHIELAFGKGAPELKRFEHSAVWSHPSNFKSKVGLFVGTLRALLRTLTTSAKAPPAPRAREAKVAVPGPLLLLQGQHALAPQVAEFLGSLGLQAIVIDGHEDHGAKVLAAPSAGSAPYAVVVLAPDEIGGAAGSARSKLLPRASQDAVFALGFLVGRLGTKRVCALLLEDVGAPSGHSGLLAFDVDAAGAWRMTLTKELQGAGLVV
ncbi:MAG: nucleotide-binding protein [Planctomycetes bacterium]|nr:nucleotide-binding protein [Planctomycetota bacterium]